LHTVRSVAEITQGRIGEAFGVDLVDQGQKRVPAASANLSA